MDRAYSFCQTTNFNFPSAVASASGRTVRPDRSRFGRPRVNNASISCSLTTTVLAPSRPGNASLTPLATHNGYGSSRAPIRPGKSTCPSPRVVTTRHHRLASGRSQQGFSHRPPARSVRKQQRLVAKFRVGTCIPFQGQGDVRLRAENAPARVRMGCKSCDFNTSCVCLGGLPARGH